MIINKKEIGIVDLLTQTNLVGSKSEARRVIGQKGVKVDDVVVNDEKQLVKLDAEKIVKVGKRKFVRARFKR